MTCRKLEVTRKDAKITFNSRKLTALLISGYWSTFNYLFVCFVGSHSGDTDSRWIDKRRSGEEVQGWSRVHKSRTASASKKSLHRKKITIRTAPNTNVHITNGFLVLPIGMAYSVVVFCALGLTQTKCKWVFTIINQSLDIVRRIAADRNKQTLLISPPYTSHKVASSLVVWLRGFWI
jgi:hypothetical protein